MPTCYGNTLEINLNLCFCCMKISCCFFFYPKINALIQVILNPRPFVEVKPRVCWNASTRRSSWWKDLVPGQSILNIQGCWKVPGPMSLGCKVGPSLGTKRRMSMDQRRMKTNKRRSSAKWWKMNLSLQHWSQEGLEDSFSFGVWAHVSSADLPGVESF